MNDEENITDDGAVQRGSESKAESSPRNHAEGRAGEEEPLLGTSLPTAGTATPPKMNHDVESFATDSFLSPMRDTGDSAPKSPKFTVASLEKVKKLEIRTHQESMAALGPYLELNMKPLESELAKLKKKTDRHDRELSEPVWMDHVQAQFDEATTLVRRFEHHEQDIDNIKNTLLALKGQPDAISGPVENAAVLGALQGELANVSRPVCRHLRRRSLASHRHSLYQYCICLILCLFRLA
jgi:hypothetical protein